MRLVLFGASADTGNLGVSALMTATVAGVLARVPDADVTVFDHGLGRGARQLDVGRAPLHYTRIGARIGHRYHRPENLTTMRVCASVGGLGNRGAQAVMAADAVLDLSGGDSFTDLYGPKRLRFVLGSKRLAIDVRAPLILLPQTYGPFTSARSRISARWVLRRAALAFARGDDSFALMGELLGPHLDPDRHRQGVDVAFALAPQAPPLEVQVWMAGFHAHCDGAPIVGLNVSGLLLNGAEAFGLADDYEAMILQLIRELRRDGVGVVLIPHVIGPRESDRDACQQVVAAIDDELVVTAPAGLSAQETKWLIGQLDWFCGTRMHSAIAALSSGVAATAIAYSAKTREVFASCGLADCVADARSMAGPDVVDLLLDRCRRRDHWGAALAEALPGVLAAADDQLDQVLTVAGRLRRSASASRGAT